MVFCPWDFFFLIPCSFVITADLLLKDLLPVSAETACFLLVFGFCFAPVCQHSSLLPPPLYSLSPLHFSRASLYSRVSIATLADMQQVSVSRGTQFFLLPLASQSAPGGCDWLARPSWLIVFTDMRSWADWLSNAHAEKERKLSRKMKRRLQQSFHGGIKSVRMEQTILAQKLCMPVVNVSLIWFKSYENTIKA